MYLRYTTRKKDGKVHRTWRLLRSIRVGGRVIQQTVAHLGELDRAGRLRARATALRMRSSPCCGVARGPIRMALAAVGLVVGKRRGGHAPWLSSGARF